MTPEDEAQWEGELEAALYDANQYEREVLTEEDRFLLDNPAPSWVERREKAPPPRIVGETRPVDTIMFPGHFGPDIPRYHPNKGEPAWDDEQFFGKTLEEWKGTVTSEPKRIPITSRLSEPLPFTTKNPRTTTSLWLCQVCRRAQAEWPREISWQRMIWGLRLSLVLRSPFACMNCRILRFEEQRSLGQRDHRLFWANVISLATDTTQTGTAGWIRWITRQRLWGPRRLIRRWLRRFR